MVAKAKSKFKEAPPPRGAAFAKGGQDKMFKPQAAGPAKHAVTGKARTAAPGAKRAAGGPPMRGAAASRPAAAGRTSPVKKG